MVRTISKQKTNNKTYLILKMIQNTNQMLPTQNEKKKSKIDFSKLYNDFKNRKLTMESIEYSPIMNRKQLMFGLNQNTFNDHSGYDLYLKNEGEWKWLNFHQFYHSFLTNGFFKERPMFSFYQCKENVFLCVTEMEHWIQEIKNNIRQVVPDSHAENGTKIIGMIDELLEEFDIIRNDRYKKEGVNNKDVPCNKTSRTLYNDTKKMDETTKKEFLEKNPDYPENSFYYFCLKCNCIQQFQLILNLSLSWIENHIECFHDHEDISLKMSMKDFFFKENFNPFKSILSIVTNYRIPIISKNPKQDNSDVHLHFKYTQMHSDHPSHIHLTTMTKRILQCVVNEIHKNNDYVFFKKVVHLINETVLYFMSNQKIKEQIFWTSQLFFDWCLIINKKLKSNFKEINSLLRIQNIMYQMFFINSKSDSVHQFKIYSEWIYQYKPTERLFKDYIMRKNVITNEISFENRNLFSDNKTQFTQQSIEKMNKTNDIQLVHKYMNDQQKYIKEYQEKNISLSMIMKSEFYHYWFIMIHKINDEDLQKKIFLILVYSETEGSDFVDIKQSLKQKTIEMYDSVDISEIQNRWEKIVIDYYSKWVEHWTKYKMDVENHTKNRKTKIQAYHALFHFYICCFMFQKYFWENQKTLSQFPMMKICYDYCQKNMDQNEMMIVLLTNVFMLLNIK